MSDWAEARAREIAEVVREAYDRSNLKREDLYAIEDVLRVSIAAALRAERERGESVIDAARHMLVDTCPVCGRGLPDHNIHCRARKLDEALAAWQEAVK